MRTKLEILQSKIDSMGYHKEAIEELEQEIRELQKDIVDPTISALETEFSNELRRVNSEISSFVSESFYEFIQAIKPKFIAKTEEIAEASGIPVNYFNRSLYINSIYVPTTVTKWASLNLDESSLEDLSGKLKWPPQLTTPGWTHSSVC